MQCRQEENGRPLPAIHLPVSDLLLPGQTKRMHLFEPRYVDMVDDVLGRTHGLVALRYLDGAGGVVPVATVAEIVSCKKLGAAGCVVIVRGVSRAKLTGIPVLDPDSWGMVLVDEISELGEADMEGGANDGQVRVADSVSRVEAEINDLMAELNNLMTELDLLTPEASPARRAGSVPLRRASCVYARKEVELWTHESSPAEEDFTAMATHKAQIERQLSGVPLRVVDKYSDSQAARQPVVSLYAALAGAALQTRAEVFADAEGGLAARLRQLAALLRERQGMARARRALAGALGEDTSARMAQARRALASAFSEDPPAAADASGAVGSPKAA